MNCLDYRRELMAGFGETDPMRVHRLGCGACTSLYGEQAAFEAELRGALEIPVPGRLVERLSAAPLRLTRLDRRRFLAAAAVGAGAAGVGLFAWLGRDDPMALACIQFVMKEEAKSIMMGAMPRAQAASALADSLPLERIERIGKVMHIGPCPFQGGTAYHVVLMVPQDKVTLLIMPGPGQLARGRATRDGMHASVVPLRRGSVGVVGSSANVVDSVAGALRG